jgi:hypothetical protein
MSSALGISAVTAVIQRLLYDVYSTASLGPVNVSAKAPDIVQTETGGGDHSALQVNVFLHQVTLNPALRNIGLPSTAADGKTLLKNPPLALDLHYLLTAYAGQDTQAEALLGYAVQVLHQNPVLQRGQIHTALTNVPASNPIADLLRFSGLETQIEMIKITPSTLGREELAWLWTALKADYRPTYPFQVSVVLIVTPAAVATGLPVLKRKVMAQPGLVLPYPSLSAVQPPDKQLAAYQGDVVTVQGTNLLNANNVVLSNPRQSIVFPIVPAAVTATSLTFKLPDPPAAPAVLPAGFYQLTVQIPSGAQSVSTNSLPLMIAPKITAGLPAAIPAGAATFNLTCKPVLQPSQQVSLFVGGQSTPVTNLSATTAATDTPAFSFADLQATSAPVPAWLQVDGVDGPTINFNLPVPVYSPAIQVN